MILSVELLLPVDPTLLLMELCLFVWLTSNRFRWDAFFLIFRNISLDFAWTFLCSTANRFIGPSAKYARQLSLPPPLFFIRPKRMSLFYFICIFAIKNIGYGYFRYRVSLSHGIKVFFISHSVIVTLVFECVQFSSLYFQQSFASCLLTFVWLIL